MHNYELINDTEKSQYEFQIGKHVAKIEYTINDQKEILLTHTEVPAALEGKGVGTQLVEAVLTDIEHNGLQLVPLCPFVIRYIEKHPEWRRLVVKKV